MPTAHRPPQLPSNWAQSISIADTAPQLADFSTFLAKPDFSDVIYSPYDDQENTRLHIPTYWEKGPAHFIEDLIMIDIISSKNFYTRHLMPYQKVNNNRFSYTRWKFDAHLLPQVPTEGVPRLTTQRMRTEVVGTVRRGRAFTLESDFYKTPMGQKNYLMNIKQISVAVQETDNYGVVYAYLTAHNAYREWEKQQGFYKKKRIQEILQDERYFWAIVQLEKNGFEKLDTLITERMTNIGGEADTWLIPPKIGLYIQNVPAEKTDFYLGGERAVTRLLDDVKNFKPFNTHTRVYQVRQFEVNPDGGTIDLMRRQRQIGEFHKMTDRYKNECDQYYDKYCTSSRDIRIYDEDSDAWYILTLRNTLNECNLFNKKTGDLIFPKSKRIVYNFEDDLKKDPFLMKNPYDESQLMNIGIFGHITEKNFSIHSRYNQARTFIGKRFNRIEETRIIYEGLALYETLSNIPPKASWFSKILKAAQKGGFVERPKDSRFWFTAVEKEWSVDNTSKFILPPTREDKDNLKGVLCGFGNFGGFQALQKMKEYNPSMKFESKAPGGSAIKGYSTAMLDRAAKFVDHVNKLADEANKVFVGSMFLNAKHTAPHFREMTSSHVIAEQLYGMDSHFAVWLADTETDPADTTTGVFTTGTKELEAGITEWIDFEDSVNKSNLKAIINKIPHLKNINLLDQFLSIFGVVLVNTQNNVRNVLIKVDAKNGFELKNVRGGYKAQLKLTSQFFAALSPYFILTELQLEIRRQLIDFITKHAIFKSEETFKQFLDIFYVKGTDLHNWDTKDGDDAFYRSLGDKAIKQPNDLKFIKEKMQSFYTWLQNNYKQTIHDRASMKTYIKGIEKNIAQAMNIDKDNLDKNYPTILKRLRLKKDDENTDIMVIVSKIIPSSKTAADKTGQFFRTPLSFSPQQVEWLYEDLISPKPTLSFVTVSTWDNPDRPSTVDDLFRTVSKIKSIRKNDISDDDPAHLHHVGSQQRKKITSNLNQSLLAFRINNAPNRSNTYRGSGTSYADNMRSMQSGIGSKRKYGTSSSSSLSRTLGLDRFADSDSDDDDDHYIGGGGGDRFDMRARKKIREDRIHYMDIDQDSSRYGGNMIGHKMTSSSGGTLHDIEQRNLHSAAASSKIPFFTEDFINLYEKLHNNTTDKLLEVISKIALATPFNKRVLERFLDEDVLFPLNILVLKPHMKYEMALAIKALAGSSTGSTYLGPSDFQTQTDGTRKVLWGNFTTYRIAHVHKPENVYIPYDIYSDGTLGGAGVLPYKKSEYQPMAGNYGRGSLFFAAVSYEETYFPEVFNISGRWLEYNHQSLIDKDDYDDLHYSTAARYNNEWGWAPKTNMGMKTLHYDQDKYNYHMSTRPNTTVFQAHTFLRARNGDWKKVDIGRGHWGDEIQIRHKEMRQGKFINLKKMEYHKLLSD